MSWRLTNCEKDCDGKKHYIVNTDLSLYNGLVLNGIELTGINVKPDSCWAVSLDVEPSVIELLGYNAFYSNCSFCVCRCCADSTDFTYGCATLDFSGLVNAIFGNDMGVQVVYTSASSSILLAQFQGDFLGFTITQVLQAITDEINFGTPSHGFTASVVGNTIVICAPAELGEAPIDSTITVNFSPVYYLKNEELATGLLPVPDDRVALGYGPISPKQVAFANSSDLLYVPNGDVVVNIYPLPNIPPAGATVNTLTADFSLGDVGDPYQTFVAPGLTTNYFQAGQQFEFTRTVVDPATGATGQTDCGALTGLPYSNLYRIRFVITAYNVATGQLDYELVSWTWQGGIQAGPFDTVTQPFTPACCPGCTGLPTGIGTTGGEPIGSGVWTFDASQQAWGTVSIYSVNLVTGALTLVITIEVNLGNTFGCVYDPVSNSVFIAGLGADLGNATIIKIDLNIDPYAVNASLLLTGVSSAFRVDINPVTQLLTIFSGNIIVSKASKTLQYTNTVNLVASNSSHSYNDVTGEIWIGPQSVAISPSLTIVRITPGLPYLFSTTDTIATIFTCSPFGQAWNDPGLVNSPTIQEVGSIYYCRQTNKLFVTRMIRDSVATGIPATFVPRGHILQVYEIGIGMPNPLTDTAPAAAITASVVNLPLPTTPNPIFNYLQATLNFQPSAQNIFISNTNTTLLYIFDPISETWNSSTVPQPHGLVTFSITDDPSEFNFFAVNPNTDWISVISATIIIERFTANFDGDITCEPCPTPEEPEVPRIIPARVRIFYQIKESQCDIDANKRFSAAYWSKVKELKYGITSCCVDVNFGSLWLDKQLSDLSEMLIPDITCTPSPSPSCCPWLPTKSCELIPDPYGGTSIVGVAGEDILFARVVTLNNNGKLYHNQPADIATYQRVVGFATQDAVVNQQARILISGQLTNTSWSLTPGAIYYTAANGTITSVVPVTGISQVVGVALSSSTLIVEIRQPIIL